MAKIILSILTIILTSCSLLPVRTVGHGSLRKAKTVDFCELSNNKDKLIKTKLIYSGVEEYWSARCLDSCRLDGEVYLNLDDYYDSWKDILVSSRMKKLFNKYWKYDAIVITKGIYEESDNGFGHLNTKHGQIRAKYLKFRIIKKRARKNTAANKSLLQAGGTVRH